MNLLQMGLYLCGSIKQLYLLELKYYPMSKSFKVVLIIALTAFSPMMYGQNGYIRLKNDSVLSGFIRHVPLESSGERGLEFWRSKTDKNPRKISKDDIIEYAIKKDTFKLIHQFKPFESEDTYFEVAEAQLQSSGKVRLYKLEVNPNSKYIPTGPGGGITQIPVRVYITNYSIIYLLEYPKTNYVRALPNEDEKLHEALIDFFPERFITKYEEVKGKIKYRNIPDLVKFYNSK